jgi:hypothetical protein
MIKFKVDHPKDTHNYVFEGNWLRSMGFLAELEPLPRKELRGNPEKSIVNHLNKLI